MRKGLLGRFSGKVGVFWIEVRRTEAQLKEKSNRIPEGDDDKMLDTPKHRAGGGEELKASTSSRPRLDVRERRKTG